MGRFTRLRRRLEEGFEYWALGSLIAMACWCRRAGGILNVLLARRLVTIYGGYIPMY